MVNDGAGVTVELGGAALMLQECLKEGHDWPVPAGKSRQERVDLLYL